MILRACDASARSLRIGRVELQELQNKHTQLQNEYTQSQDKQTELQDMYTQIQIKHAEGQQEYTQLRLAHTNTSSQLEAETSRSTGLEEKVEQLQREVDDLIEVMRRDMSERINSKNSAEDLMRTMTLSSQLTYNDQGNPRSPATTKSRAREAALREHDWKALMSHIHEGMSDIDVSEIKATLMHFKKSFDALSSRFDAECRSRSSAEAKLNETREDLNLVKRGVQEEMRRRDEVCD